MANAPDNFDGDRRAFDVERRDTVVIFVGFGVEIDGAGGFLSPRRRGRNHRQIDVGSAGKSTTKSLSKSPSKTRQNTVKNDVKSANLTVNDFFRSPN